MIVEDERVARTAMAWLLSFSGYSPHAFATAEDALSSLDHDREHAPAMALVDIDLPGMSGLELASRLVREHPHLRVVLVTASDAHRLDDFRQQGVSYVRKPVDFRHLLQVMAGATPPN